MTYSSTTRILIVDQSDCRVGGRECVEQSLCCHWELKNELSKHTLVITGISWPHDGSCGFFGPTFSPEFLDWASQWEFFHSKNLSTSFRWVCIVPSNDGPLSIEKNRGNHNHKPIESFIEPYPRSPERYPVWCFLLKAPFCQTRSQSRIWVLHFALACYYIATDCPSFEPSRAHTIC
jgi:hypothetical protein